MGLAALGHANVRLLLLPQLELYMGRLQPLLSQPHRPAGEGGAAGAVTANGGAAAAGAASTPQQRAEAWRVHGALLDAVSAAMYDRVLASVAEQLPEEHLASVRYEYGTCSPFV